MSLADLFNDDLSDDDSDEEDFQPEDVPEEDDEIEVEEGAFALHDATESGSVTAVSAVLDIARTDGELDASAPGFYMNKRDKNGCAPLHIAIMGRHLDCARALFKAGAGVNKLCHGNSPLHLAVVAGSFPGEESRGFARAMAELLLQHNAVIARAPPGGGGTDGVRTLVRDGATRTSLHLAAASGQLKLASMLIAALANNSSSSDDSINNGARHGKISKCTADFVAAVDRTGSSALHLAARFSHAEVVSLLLESGADANLVDRMGRTPLHLACAAAAGGLPAARDCVKRLVASGANANLADDMGLNPAQWAEQCGTVPSVSSAAKDRTLVVTHPSCGDHHTCTHKAYSRSGPDPPPENIHRLEVLLNDTSGALRMGEFAGTSGLVKDANPPRCAIVDVMRCHDHGYVSNLAKMCGALPEHGTTKANRNKAKWKGKGKGTGTLDDLADMSDSDDGDDDEDDLFGDSSDEDGGDGGGGGGSKKAKSNGELANGHAAKANARPKKVTRETEALDSDTVLSRGSFEAALHAAGAVCHAISEVCNGRARNAFCATRPPGHHAGPSGIENSEHDKCGSHGFCLFNNAAVGAAYARCVLRGKVDKVAILDFDVHHGNGTEAIVRNLTPQTREIEMKMVGAGMLHGSKISFESYKPWRDDSDHENVFFASVHGYGPRDIPAGEIYFYPGSGKTADDIGGNVVNVGLGKNTAMEWRGAWREKILPALYNFNPDLILISAGFDAHEHDALNHDFINLQDEDYEWFTQKVQSIANVCCEGRVVSVLEGGYRVQSGAASPFARSVSAHVRGLHRVDFTQKWDPSAAAAEVEREWRAREAPRRHRDEEEERRAARTAAMRAAMAMPQAPSKESSVGAPAASAPAPAFAASGQPSRKRRRGGPAPDYAALNAKMDLEKKMQRKA